MTQTTRAVIFDLDGTLLDTLSDIASAMNRVLARHAMPEHAVDAYRTMVGSGLRVLVARAVPDEARADDSLVASMAGELREAYAADPVVRTKAYDGVDELLASLGGMGLPMAVLSNKADPLVQRIVRELFDVSIFRLVQGMRDDVPAKPDPTSALAIARALEVEPADVVYLGDSDVDVRTARNAGMVAVGAGWGFRGEAELVAAGADAVIDRPIDLVELIQEER